MAKNPAIIFRRHRRLRSHEAIRRLVRETRISAHDLVMPFFVQHGQGLRHPIPSMPGQFQLSIDQLLLEAKKASKLGIQAVLLFGLPKKKDLLGTEAYHSNGIIQQAVKALKKKLPDLMVITDLCFCQYTGHGHCGVLKKSKNNSMVLDNDATLSLIQKAALAQASAGADMVAPSGMIDGSVAAIRRALDTHGFHEVGILAYSAKYASAFYGPFRDAAGSRPHEGDRKAHQMDPANLREALREIEEDIAQGADIVMIKPALAYLDVIARAALKFNVPIAAFNVSGEYAMVKASEKLGWLQGGAEEIVMAIKRAGADMIISYHAIEIAARLLK